MTTRRVLLHIAAQRDYKLHYLDFSTAFLQGSLHEQIWLRRPPHFTGTFPPGTQWKLRRPVYGLRQAPREWHDTLRTTLAALDFFPLSADPSLFVRHGSTPFFVLVYVDDLVFATPDRHALASVKEELQRRHTCIDLGELQRYLGLQITRDRIACTITLTLSHMVKQILTRFRFPFSKLLVLEVLVLEVLELPEQVVLLVLEVAEVLLELLTLEVLEVLLVLEGLELEVLEVLDVLELLVLEVLVLEVLELPELVVLLVLEVLEVLQELLVLEVLVLLVLEELELLVLPRADCFSIRSRSRAAVEPCCAAALAAARSCSPGGLPPHAPSSAVPPPLPPHAPVSAASTLAAGFLQLYLPLLQWLSLLLRAAALSAW
ncbi:unnamed protein product [Closterium sp. NIES-54]